jgi:hypothetical protein
MPGPSHSLQLAYVWGQMCYAKPTMRSGDGSHRGQTSRGSGSSQQHPGLQPTVTSACCGRRKKGYEVMREQYIKMHLLSTYSVLCSQGTARGVARKAKVQSSYPPLPAKSQLLPC